MSRMIEVVIDSVRVSLTNQQRIVVLREKDSERYLPIWIGTFEAEAITIALQEVEVARPQTHDLLKNMLTQLGGRLVRVEVINLREDVFFGNLVVEQNGRTINIDSRPSDALALAVRAHVPVLIARDVMDAAAVYPDQDVQVSNQGSTPSPQAPKKPAEDPASQERLSVFEDFLSNLNLEDLTDQDDEGDEPEDPKSDKDK